MTSGEDDKEIATLCSAPFAMTHKGDQKLRCQRISPWALPTLRPGVLGLSV